MCEAEGELVGGWMVGECVNDGSNSRCGLSDERRVKSQPNRGYWV